MPCIVDAVHMGRPRPVRVDALELQARGVRAIGVERGGLRAVWYVHAVGVPPPQDEQLASCPEFADKRPPGAACRPRHAKDTRINKPVI